MRFKVLNKTNNNKNEVLFFLTFLTCINTNTKKRHYILLLSTVHIHQCTSYISIVNNTFVVFPGICSTLVRPGRNSVDCK